MKLAQQVCSLDLAKKLKALGVKQESLFWWNEYDEFDSDDWREHKIKNYRKRTTLKPYAVQNTSYPECGEAVKNAVNISAFTVGELGKIELRHFKLPYWHEGNGWQVPVMQKAGIYHRCENECDARAKMLIYLIENGIVKP